MTARPKCGECGHVAHRDQCRGKAPSGCVPLDGGGFACYRGGRPPCPCPWGWCHRCRAPIVGATPPGGEDEVDLDRYPRGVGKWAVRELPDGSLACRPLASSEHPGAGERRAREHECGTETT